MKWLNYHHLYYFRTIAKEGGIAKAAQKLRLGQPTLSTQLKQLEETFEQPLFERKNRTLVLTETGKIALEYADDIFGLGNELLQVLEDKTFTDRQDIKLGVLDTIPKHLVLALTNDVLRSGSCTLTILEGRGDELLRELFAHQIDLMVSDYPPIGVGQDRTFSKSIAKVPIGIFAAPKFNELKKKFPQSLNGQPMLMPTSHSKLRHDLDHYFNVNRIHPRLVVETQDGGLRRLLGTEGLGVIPMAEFAVQDLVDEKKLIKLGTLSTVKSEFWLLSANRRIENPIAARMMQEFTYLSQ